MEQKLSVYNTLTRTKEVFEPLHAPHVGMYVCGPTVYGDAHLGHARPAITFDILFRYLTHLGYKVRYVRNITDVGHLENDADEGEDKIGKKARLEELEPMEVVQYYTNRYHEAMEMLNVLPPSIEPHASGHIIEQIETIEKILENGYAYESNGSVYFDVEKYNKDYNYGSLSHRNIEDMLNTTRELDGQDEKKNKVDFALWKKASPEHIMRWKAKFKYKIGAYNDGSTKYKQITSIGFPGWHLECSAMSIKYLGNEFDIHGGGLDLMFPHHECEIAQNTAMEKHCVVKYWMHNNMITIGGQKMGKSLGNFITLEEFFSGSHKILSQAYSPMTIRFFILQAHYRSTVDFSNDALQAAERGLERLLEAYDKISKIPVMESSSSFAKDLWRYREQCYNALNDDLNTAVLISVLFDLAGAINRDLIYSHYSVTKEDIDEIKDVFDIFLFKILGIKNSKQGLGEEMEILSEMKDVLDNIRGTTRRYKDWKYSDLIRVLLADKGIEIKDGTDGTEWKLNNRPKFPVSYQITFRLNNIEYIARMESTYPISKTKADNFILSENAYLCVSNYMKVNRLKGCPTIIDAAYIIEGDEDWIFFDVI